LVRGVGPNYSGLQDGRSAEAVSVFHESRGGSYSCRIRRKHGVQLQQVRRALDYVQKKCHVPRPLIDQSFQTAGRFLFIEQLERLVNASKGGQLAMPDLLPQLDRIERDPAGLPSKLYPFTRAVDTSRSLSDPKIVVMNPRISFGRPSVGGVATSAIWSRFRGGDSPALRSQKVAVRVEQ
jgi:hypothetical protein